MIIQIDSREHKSELKRVQKQLSECGAQSFISKLYVGDYMNLHNPLVIVDRKQSLQELSGNICQEHDRFRAELIRAKEAGIQIIILCEHGEGIRCIEDVIFWDNPRRSYRKKVDGRWQTVETKAITGQTMYNILTTLQRKYGVMFEFCDKNETGRRIVELLEVPDEC